MKIISLALCLALTVSFYGCSGSVEKERNLSSSSIKKDSFSISSKADITSNTAVNNHSEYFTNDYSADDVADSFFEVVLNAEYVDSPDSDATDKVKKWLNKIEYTVIGNASEEDLEVLDAFVLELNKVKGMPKIYGSASPDTANFIINFCSVGELNQICPDEEELINGYTTVWWYNDTLEIHDAVIYVRDDIDQEIRNRVIRHEIYQSLGIISDTSREDSVIYESDLTADKMSKLDLLILKLLYSDKIKPGMDQAQCLEVIKELYY